MLSLTAPHSYVSKTVFSRRYPLISPLRQLLALTLIAAIWAPTVSLAGAARAAGVASPIKRGATSATPSSRIADSKAEASTASPKEKQSAPPRDSRGTDFWLVVPDGAGDASSRSLLISSEVDTTGSVAVSSSNFTTSFSVAAGTTATNVSAISVSAGRSALKMRGWKRRA